MINDYPCVCVLQSGECQLIRNLGSSCAVGMGVIALESLSNKVGINIQYIHIKYGCYALIRLLDMGSGDKYGGWTITQHTKMLYQFALFNR